MAYRIKNWAEFQHFKDRTPPWIKLYRKLLDDMEWHLLDPQPAKTLVSLWLIASEYEGSLPDSKKLAFRLRLSEKQVISDCSKLSHWLEQVDISAISGRYQHDRLETERETEREIEGEKETERVSAPSSSFGKPDEVTQQVWDDYLKVRKAKKAPAMTATAMAGMQREVDAAGIDLQKAFEICCERNWVGFKADWYAEPKRGQQPLSLVNKQEALEISNREIAARWAAKMGGNNGAN